MRTAAMVALAFVTTLVACADEGHLPSESSISVPLFAQGAGGGKDGIKNFRTHATAAEEVPSNDSRAQGQAIFQLNEDGTELHYKLIVANIQDVSAAHIHLAPRGVNGGVVAWLFPPSPPGQLLPGRTQGILEQGAITDADVVGPLEGAGLPGLLEEMLAGNTYVNVHTSELPGGEIRGQID